MCGERLPALKWGAPDAEGIVSFLVGEKSFNEDRVRKTVERITASKNKSTQGIALHFSLLPRIATVVSLLDNVMLGKIVWNCHYTVIVMSARQHIGTLWLTSFLPLIAYRIIAE